MTEQMDKPWELNGDWVLVLTDIHQNVAWAKAVLEREKGNYDKVVWLGDFIDSHHEGGEGIAGARETAEFWRECVEKDHVLLGNHDAPVMESYSHNSNYRRKHGLLHACSGHTQSKSEQFNKVVTWEHWKKVRLFYVVNGWLVSHAGVHPGHWRPLRTDEQNLEMLWNDSLEALDQLPFRMHPLLVCGRSRGGEAEVPGLTWQDFFSEFKDELPLPQLCGHTHAKKIMQCGRSFDIDTGQRTYALIHRDGSVEFKGLHRVMKGMDVEDGITWISDPNPDVVRIDVARAEDRG